MTLQFNDYKMPEGYLPVHKTYRYKCQGMSDKPYL